MQLAVMSRARYYEKKILESLTCLLNIEDNRRVPVRKTLDVFAALLWAEPDAAERVAEVAAGLHEVDRDPPTRLVSLVRDEKSFLELESNELCLQTWSIFLDGPQLFDWGRFCFYEQGRSC